MRITSIAEELMSTYADDVCPHVTYRGPRLPDRKTVHSIAAGLLPIFFPGYYGPPPTAKDFGSYFLRHLSWMKDRLTDQAVRARLSRAEAEPRGTYHRP